MNLEKNPPKQAGPGALFKPQTPPTAPQASNTIRPNQIRRKLKENYLTHRKESTKKESKLEYYLALHREYTVAEYLTTVKTQT